MGKRHAIEWAKNHIKQRKAQALTTNKGVYIFTKSNNEPEFYKDLDEYTAYHHPYGYN